MANDVHRVGTRSIVVGTMLMIIAGWSHANEYGHYDIKSIVTVSESPNGQHSASINFSLLDKVLDDITIHNSSYPSNFDSQEDRRRAVSDVVELTRTFDILLRSAPPPAPVLLRAGVLYGLGHNLDIPGDDEKANKAFTTLLGISPDDPRANYLYGRFLASTMLVARSIPYLEKAKSLGVLNADYTLGLAYSAMNNRDKALENLEEYAKRTPNDMNVLKLIDAIRHGNIELKPMTPPQALAPGNPQT
jgi:tetratricopeptide (TPR) repeat protein